MEPEYYCDSSCCSCDSNNNNKRFMAFPSFFREDHPTELIRNILSYCDQLDLYSFRAANNRCRKASDLVLEERTLSLLPLGFSEVSNTDESSHYLDDDDDNFKFGDDEDIQRQRKVQLQYGWSNFSSSETGLIDHAITEALSLDGADEVPFLASAARRELGNGLRYSAVADMDLYKMELHLQVGCCPNPSNPLDKIMDLMHVIQLPTEQQTFLRRAAFSLLLNGGSLLRVVETDCVCNEMHSWEKPPATTFERKRTRALVFMAAHQVPVELVFTDFTSMDFM